MPMAQILLTGCSGLIGTALVRALHQERISTTALIREPSRGTSRVESQRQVLWDPYSATPVSDPRQLDGITAAVHLSGANVAGGNAGPPPINGKFSTAAPSPRAPWLLFWPPCDRSHRCWCVPRPLAFTATAETNCWTEDSLPGSGFLPEVCVAWEAATKPAVDAGIRVVYARFGVVLSPRGGALAKMLPMFRMGLGGTLGGGKQWMSWIALPDAVRAILFALHTSELQGAVNVVAPNPATNLAFTHALGRAVHRPTLLPVPAFALKAAFGEMAEASVLGSTRVLCTRLRSAGFACEYPDLPSALQALLQVS